MDKIIDNLWVGDIVAARDVEMLNEAGIKYVVSCMRGKVRVHETMQRHQIPLDDTWEQDVLCYLPAAIAFIQKALASGDGVLIHCMAGMSRSATIAAAYLMHSQGLDPTGALELIRKARPIIHPNPHFLHQLEVFHASYCKITKRDKNIREYYLERMTEEIINGDGSVPDMSMIASYPRTPTASAPATPGGPRRRIRCKMCRHELATREHMMEHSQGGPTTPVSATGSATISRRQSFKEPEPIVSGLQLTSDSRRPSIANRPVRSSSLNQSMVPGGAGGILGGGLAPLAAVQDKNNDSKDTHPDRRPSVIASEAIKRLSMLAMTSVNDDGPDDYAVDDEDEDEASTVETTPNTANGTAAGTGHGRLLRSNSASRVARRGLPYRISLPTSTRKSLELPRTPADEVAPGSDASLPIDPSIAQAVAAQEREIEPEEIPMHTQPTDIYASFPPKLASLRRPSVVQAFKASGLAGMTPISQSPAPSPPILFNPKCSGYFVEPLKWMQPFLEKGQLAGKIICPNPKCGTKLGNYDWAGVNCSCKEWVTPGFCIHRSKVDEIW